MIYKHRFVYAELRLTTQLVNIMTMCVTMCAEVCLCVFWSLVAHLISNVTLIMFQVRSSFFKTYLIFNFCMSIWDLSSSTANKQLFISGILSNKLINALVPHVFTLHFFILRIYPEPKKLTFPYTQHRHPWPL